MGIVDTGNTTTPLGQTGKWENLKATRWNRRSELEKALLFPTYELDFKRQT